MADNFFSFVNDEAAASARTYKDLTEDDKVFLEAAVRRDYETTSALLDKYFRKMMPDTRCKHMVWRRDDKKDIWVYRTRRGGKSDVGRLGEGVCFYGVEKEAWDAVEYGRWIQGFYINVKAPFSIDRDVHDALVRRNGCNVSERLAAYLGRGKLKMDGCLWTGDMREEWSVFSPCQIKRADITRDDENRIIPISMRFDLSNPDNRY